MLKQLAKAQGSESTDPLAGFNPVYQASIGNPDRIADVALSMFDNSTACVQPTHAHTPAARRATRPTSRSAVQRGAVLRGARQVLPKTPCVALPCRVVRHGASRLRHRRPLCRAALLAPPTLTADAAVSPAPQRLPGQD